MEEHKTLLTDSLVKAAAWTQNTLVNTLGYSPLQLVIGQAVMIPWLTTDNQATESMPDSEAVKRTMENKSAKNRKSQGQTIFSPPRSTIDRTWERDGISELDLVF